VHHAGVYRLECREPHLPLYLRLSLYLSSDMGAALRPGARVRLSNVHPICLGGVLRVGGGAGGVIEERLSGRFANPFGRLTP
jgi:hypothetical protein